MAAPARRQRQSDPLLPGRVLRRDATADPVRPASSRQSWTTPSMSSMPRPRRAPGRFAIPRCLVPISRTGQPRKPATSAGSTRPATMKCTTRSRRRSRRPTDGLESLKTRPFVATESRLHTAVELLRQIVHGTDTDPESRLTDLRRRRAEIDAEIAAVEAGRLPVLEPAGVRDRYQQFTSTARELLSDFREVEENFRRLDRAAREKIATWDGSKGGLLAELVGSRSEITQSDQGHSFQAFYDFLLSDARQAELTGSADPCRSAGRHRAGSAHPRDPPRLVRGC